MPDTRPFTELEQQIFDLLMNEIERLIRDIKEMQAQYYEDLREFQEDGVSNPLNDLRLALKSLREILIEFAEYRDSTRALQALTNWSMVHGQSQNLESQLQALSQASPVKGIRNAATSLVQKLSGWFSYLQAAIQSISTKLWSLISKYLNLKEWSIKGTVTSPAIVSLFSFSGSAELQLTFGP